MARLLPLTSLVTLLTLCPRPGLAADPGHARADWPQFRGPHRDNISPDKGLLTVTSNDLRFHESRAVPAGDVASDASSISGKFAFTGEGRSWTKYEALKIQNHTLVRTEMNPTASFTYAKCS